ncbi:FAD-dependent monooxygenase [Nocardia yamanashiensis]|uniref:FAD-dependent monooxygenase n=1 Tax=Nocardia yamanashiensis TaxID=209247 RepID=UPI000AB97429|nr:FAD-dependent monooxygenase [Nocardia yamanashiensis]
MRVLDTDVVIVGAGPSGLMLASELRLAGVRAVVLERHPELWDVPKASGIGGRILDLLRYRGLLERFEAVSSDPYPPLRLPFGGMHLDFTRMAEAPMKVLPMAQMEIERLLAARGEELGAEIRRGHRVDAVLQDEESVTAEVTGPAGAYAVTARYLVACDGGRSRIREMAGIVFSGTTYPEVVRLAQVSVGEGVTVYENGDLEVPGFGRVAAGFTRTEHGQLAFASTPDGALHLSTTEDETAEYDDDVVMTLEELQGSIRRVLGAEIPMRDAKRLSRFTFKDRQAEQYRAGRIFVAGDAAHLFPSTGVALNAGMLDTVNLAWKLGAEINGWAPEGLLDTYHDERHAAGARTRMQARAQVALRRGQDAAAEALRELFQELTTDEPALRRVGDLIAGNCTRYPQSGSEEHALVGTFAPDLALRTEQGASSVAALLRTARPILLVLADRPDLREIAEAWRDRVEIHTAATDERPADALLIRPDAHIAWAAAVDEPAHSSADSLRRALTGWFGAPLTAVVR